MKNSMGLMAKMYLENLVTFLRHFREEYSLSSCGKPQLNILSHTFAKGKIASPPPLPKTLPSFNRQVSKRGGKLHYLVIGNFKQFSSL